MKQSHARDILIIANPVAGKGKTVHKTRVLADLLRSRNHRVEVFITEKAGDATTRASNVRSSCDRIVIAGGDGTVNEVLNGLEEPFSIPIIHFATGTANQLAHHLKTPKKPAKLVHLIEDGTIRRIDMGLVGAHRFLLQTSAGFDALVTKVMAEQPRIGSGYLAYALPIVRALFRHGLADVDVQIDGGPAKKARGVIITKVSHYGGIFVFCKTASMDTGAFDICLFHEKSLVVHLCSFLAALLRLTPYVPWISHERGTHVVIQASSPTPVQIDGTYMGTTPIEVHLAPQAVPVLVAAPRP
ncbi:MAG: diacylglycerol/lipid kinase family protein [Desulfomonilaceae bacterium]